MRTRAAITLACAVCAACSLFVDTGEFTSGDDVPLDGGDASPPESDGALTSHDTADAHEANPRR